MEYVVELFSFTIIFGYLFYKWANKNFECFSRRNVAHEKPVFLIGNNLSVLEGKESSPELLIRLHNQFKNEKIYGYYGFRSPHFFIRDPELIQQIGIKDFDSFTNHADNKAMMSDETIANMLTVLKDEKWKDMRMMLAPVFTEIKISQVFHVISLCNREAINYLKETIKPEGTEIDFEDYFHRYSNDVIASAAFGLEIDSYKNKGNEFSNMVTVLLRTRSLCVAVKEFYLSISPQVYKVYRLNRIYIKSLAYVRRLINKTFGSSSKDKITQEGSIAEKKENEFINIIKALLYKSSTAIKLIVLTIFPQITIIVHIFSFVQTIRKYVKGLFNSKAKPRHKEQTTCYEDTDPQDKKNTILQVGTSILGKITGSIKLLFFTFFPQILWISRLYFVTKKLINYLRGKTVQQEVFDKNKKKKLSKMESAFLKFQRFVVIIKLLILMYFPKISKIVKLNAFNARALNYFKGLARQTIRQRQDDKIIRQDMVHLMLEALKQEENDVENKSDDENTCTKYTNKCTESEMVAQCILFLFAGLGPMINMLCATIYELMTNQEIQEKLFKEVAKINEKLNGTEISYDLLNDMKYLDMVVSESLRKWPSVPLLDRVCSKPYTLKNADGESIAEFMPDDIICFSVYGSHFDDEYFENPFTFDPERFSEQNKSNIKPSTYFPFGVGSRSCIGSKFGLMVGKIMLYHLVLEFKFDSGPRSIPDLLAAKRKIQLKQSEFYWMTIFPRVKEQILCEL